MEMIIGLLLFVTLFIGGLLLSDYAYRNGGTMEERRAVVFEVYRYAICFIMVIVFGMLAFQLVGALVTDATNTQALTGPAVGVIISIILFLIHWLMPNPGLPKVPKITATTGGTDTPAP